MIWDEERNRCGRRAHRSVGNSNGDRGRPARRRRAPARRGGVSVEGSLDRRCVGRHGPQHAAGPRRRRSVPDRLGQAQHTMCVVSAAVGPGRGRPAPRQTQVPLPVDAPRHARDTRQDSGEQQATRNENRDQEPEGWAGTWHGLGWAGLDSRNGHTAFRHRESSPVGSGRRRGSKTGENVGTSRHEHSHDCHPPRSLRPPPGESCPGPRCSRGACRDPARRGMRMRRLHAGVRQHAARFDEAPGGPLRRAQHDQHLDRQLSRPGAGPQRSELSAPRSADPARLRSRGAPRPGGRSRPAGTAFPRRATPRFRHPGPASVR